jgi:hypothetical protein
MGVYYEDTADHLLDRENARFAGICTYNQEQKRRGKNEWPHVA